MNNTSYSSIGEYIDRLMQTPEKQKALKEVDVICAAKMENYNPANPVRIGNCPELVEEMKEDDRRRARELSSSGLRKVIR